MNGRSRTWRRTIAAGHAWTLYGPGEHEHRVVRLNPGRELLIDLHAHNDVLADRWTRCLRGTGGVLNNCSRRCISCVDRVGRRWLHCYRRLVAALPQSGACLTDALQSRLLPRDCQQAGYSQPVANAGLQVRTRHSGNGRIHAATMRAYDPALIRAIDQAALQVDRSSDYCWQTQSPPRVRSSRPGLHRQLAMRCQRLRTASP